MSGGLGPHLHRVHRVAFTVYNVFVDAILDKGRRIGSTEQAPRIGFILGEEEFRLAFAQQPAFAVRSVVQLDHRCTSDAVFLRNGQIADRR